MTNLACKCGLTLSNVMYPNEMEGEICGIFEYQPKNVWECYGCGRLWIDIPDPEIKNGHISKSYVPEDGKPARLFSEGSTEDFIENLKWQWNLYKYVFLEIDSGKI